MRVWGLWDVPEFMLDGFEVKLSSIELKLLVESVCACVFVRVCMCVCVRVRLRARVCMCVCGLSVPSDGLGPTRRFGNAGSTGGVTALLRLFMIMSVRKDIPGVLV